jgi:hypothetical protein
MARIHEVLSPKPDFKPLDGLGKSTFFSNFGNIAKQERFILPQATVNLTGISRMAEDMNERPSQPPTSRVLCRTPACQALRTCPVRVFEP